MSRSSKSVLAMSLLVRDEASLIRHNIEFHHRMGVDAFVITDNASVDGTREIIENLSTDYRIVLIDEPEHTMKQNEWVGRMAQVATDQLGADWIINSDADEFWLPSGGSLKTAISTSAGALLCPRSNMVPDRATLGSPAYTFYQQVLRVTRPFDDDEQSCQPPWQLSERPMIMTRIGPKVMCRLDGLHGVHYGSHGVDHEGPVRESADVHIYHYPVRSFPEFRSKVINHGTSLKSNPDIPGHLYWHLRRWFSLYEHGLLREEYNRLVLDEARERLYLDTGVLEPDHSLWHALAPESAPTAAAQRQAAP